MARSRKKLSGLFVNTVTFISLAVIICVGFYFVEEYQPYQNSSSLPDDISQKNLMDKQYADILSKAASLSNLYQNLTGKMPPTKQAEFDLIVKSVKNQGLSSEIAGSVVSVDKDMDIVIGMAQDTDPKNLAVFCSSLRKYSSSASVRVVLFVNKPVPDRHIEIAKATDVQLIEFDLKKLSLTTDGSFAAKYHPSSLRWSLILKYFEDSKVRKSYQKILMIDVRDSFFQSDPFAIIPTKESAFYVYKGVETIQISQCGWNGGWVRDCFGEQTLRDIGHNNIICSGVSIGTMDSVYEYLTLMDDILMNKKKSTLSQQSLFPKCERNGVDQGIHNVLVHKGMIKNLKIFSQRDSQVLNLQAKTARVSGKLVLNANGDKVAIVHQYDRYPELQKALFNEYVYWVNTNDFEAEWKAESTCDNFGHKMDVELFKARCDLKMQGGATSAASCCSYCQKNTKCKAFTYLSGTCHLKDCSDIRGTGMALKGAVTGFLK